MSRILGLFLILALLGCGDSTPPTVEIAEYYRTGDAGSFEKYIHDNHQDVRSQIDDDLAKFLDSKINNDTLALDSSDSMIAWLTENYERVSGISDLSRQYFLFKSWKNDKLGKKKYLDSLLEIYIEDLRAGRDGNINIALVTNGYNNIGDSLKLSYIYYIRGYDLYSRQYVDSARYLLGSAIRIGSLWDNLEIVAMSDLIMAKIHNIHLGDFYKSVTFYQNAALCFHKLGMYKRARYAHWGLGHDFLKIYKGNRAIRQFKAALDISSTINDTAGVALSLNYIGEAYFDFDLLDSASIYAGKSLKLKQDYLQKDTGDLSEIGYSLSTLGLIKQAQKEYESSKYYFKQANFIFSDCGDSTGLFMNQLRLASLYLDQSHYDSASVIYHDILINVNKYEETLAAMFGLGVCKYYGGRKSEAMDDLKNCIKLFENSRGKLPTPELKTGLLSDKIGFYQLLSKGFVDQYHRNSQPVQLDSAFKYIEQSKAIAFTELLSREKEVSSKSRNVSLRQISSLYRSLILGHGEKSAIIKQIETAEDSLFRLAYDTPVKGDAAQDKPIDLGYARGHLVGENQVILQYSLSNYGSFCLIISGDTIEVFPISTNLESITKKILFLTKLINKHPRQNSMAGDFRAVSRDLYDALVPAELITEYKQIVIIPSGPLHYLPFEVLLDSDDVFLAETKAISYGQSVNSLKLIIAQHKGRSAEKNVLAFGDPIFDLNWENRGSHQSEFVEREFTIYDDWNIAPISETRSEIEKIENIFGSESTDIYLSTSATESNFRKQAGKNYSYIHLALHGISDVYNPHRSAMIFSIIDNKLDDGLLHTNEIYSMDLKSDLVFLSACKTGTGKFMPGEGVMNLARPFLVTGARSTIVTLWNINDKSTSEFVGVFYKRLQSGDSKADALVFAKRYFIGNQRKLYRHPYFWAPFILIGDWN